MVLQLWRSERGWRWGGAVRPDLGGEVTMIPRDLEAIRESGELSRLRWRLLIFLAGGPLASLALVIVSAALLWLFVPERLATVLPPPFPGFVRGLLGTVCWVGVIILAPSLFRLIFGTATRSDEYEIRKLFTGGAAAQEVLEDRVCGYFLFDGGRPREWLPAWLRHSYRVRILATARPAEESGILLHAYYSALDEGEHTEAADLLAGLRTALSRAPESLLHPHFSLITGIETAFMEAFSGGDAAEARATLEEAYGSARTLQHGAEGEPALDRAEAAVSLAEGDHDRAAEYATRALAQLGTIPPVPPGDEPTKWAARRVSLGSRVAEREWLEAIREAAEQMRTQPA
jgi:hypothetical protein